MRRLVIRPGAIGDFILSLPAIESLETAYLEVWTREPNVPLVRFAQRVRSIAATGLDLLGVEETPDSRLVGELRSFDSIVSWYGANRPEFRALTASLGLPFKFFPALPAAGGGVHATDFYLQQVQHLPVARRGESIPHLSCPGAPSGFAILHPFASSPAKRWPMDRFAELARCLEQRIPVHWCAGPEDELPGAVRTENLFELASWIATADLFVGNDSGISHLAAAAGTRTVALFGPTDPGVWAPRGPDVRVVARERMDDIALADVLRACKDV